ncbi:hypothetical protein EVAR_4051_1 [Eumeta japonica]|uniref:Uncharacterized protein n=1 Tax=Eumeta variegata TaxID=151549 RepID=A0A4C1T444_EUMVA|nr:hypothetical protein EVAR_4051_1 [Eumeta japonica]
MSSRDRDAVRKFESGSSKTKRAIKRKQVQENLRGSLSENIPSTSSWVPPPSSSKNSEDDDELTTSLSFRSSVPPSTLSSQEHESEPESTSTFMTVGMENMNPQNDTGSNTQFAGSSQRWAILNAHVKSLLLKPLSETRWECRVSSVKAVKYQLSDICDALKDLAENTTDCQLVGNQRNPDTGLNRDVDPSPVHDFYFDLYLDPYSDQITTHTEKSTTAAEFSYYGMIRASPFQVTEAVDKS